MKNISDTCPLSCLDKYSYSALARKSWTFPNLNSHWGSELSNAVGKQQFVVVFPGTAAKLSTR